MTWEGLTPPYATIVVDPPWPYEDNPMGDFHGGRLRRFLPYSTMTLTEIAALPISNLALPGAHLYLWATQRYLWDAKRIAEGWGWDVGPVIVWCKPPLGEGGGGAWANTSEFILACRRPIGDLIRVAREAAGMTQRQLSLQVRGTEPTGLVGMWEKGIRWPNQDDWSRLASILDLPSPIVPAWLDRIRSTWFQWPRGPHSAKPPAFLDLVEQVSPAPRVELFARAQRLGWDSWGRGYEYAV